MNSKLSRLGPRAWAFIIVSAGCCVALPFMRGNRKPDHNPSSEPISTIPFSSHRLPLHSDSSGDSDRPTANTLTRSSSFRLPPPGTIPSPASDPTQPTVTNEFPEWARKPSPLDVLIESTETGADTVAPVPPLRKPTQQPVWSDDKRTNESVAMKTVEIADRYSPFSDGSHPLDQQPPSLAQLVWPDQGMTVDSLATSGPANELVGGRSRTDSGPMVSHQFKSAIAGEESFPKRAVGAALRSQVVPSKELFIQQPGISN